MKGITKTLAKFIAKTTFEDLPNKVIHEVKRNLLDTIGCALGGLATDIGIQQSAEKTEKCLLSYDFNNTFRGINFYIIPSFYQLKYIFLRSIHSRDLSINN